MIRKYNYREQNSLHMFVYLVLIMYLTIQIKLRSNNVSQLSVRRFLAFYESRILFLHLSSLGQGCERIKRRIIKERDRETERKRERENLKILRLYLNIDHIPHIRAAMSRVAISKCHHLYPSIYRIRSTTRVL